ncbi:hypothetical protein GCM10017562_45920 [Streptomyces roseofulvus]|uniref:DUF6234 family protein n=1 Tax=Streptomyces roseofulvus TaxID=33902 RepID=UPI0031FE0735
MTPPRPRVRPALDLAFAVLLLAADAAACLMAVLMMGLRGLGWGAPPDFGPPPFDWVPVGWFAALAAAVAATGWALRSHGWRAAAWTQLGAAGLLALGTAAATVSSGG